MTLSGGLLKITEPELKIASASDFGSTLLIELSQARRAESFSVEVGLLRWSVSEMIPLIITPAISGDGLSPSRRKRSATIVQVEPTGSLMKRIGCCVFKEPRRW